MKKLRFYFNKELDKRIAEEFLNVHNGGIDFGKGILKTHPRLKSIKLSNIQQNKKIINLYFNNYYRTHRVEMRRKVEYIRRAWRKQEQKYIAITKNLFGGFRFPHGRYVAYASIINCNPRFLDSKTFQFFYKKTVTDAIQTIAHELLHFVFFDFVKQKLKSDFHTLPPEKLWDLSEIFNVIILRSSHYRRLINPRYVHFYPAHRKYSRRFESAYQKSSNVREFIQQGIVIINSK